MQGQQHSALQAVQVASNLAQKGVKEAEFSKQLLDMLDRCVPTLFLVMSSISSVPLSLSLVRSLILEGFLKENPNKRI